MKRWSKEADVLIVERWETMPRKDLWALLEVTERQLRRRAAKLGLKAKKIGGANIKSWAKKEDLLVIKHWGTMRFQSLCELLGVSETQLRCRAKHLKLKPRSQKHWTEQEDGNLVEKWEVMSRAALARELGVSPVQLRYRATQLGLDTTSRTGGDIEFTESSWL